jgi:NAD(P)H-dependent flavin oxidoreductase YrpB (nitropropane dioxygenase family)
MIMQYKTVFSAKKIEIPKIQLSKLRPSALTMPRLKIGDLKIKIPIIQGGMGVGISLSGLASSVANEGGVGVIAANGIGLLEADYFTNGKEANIRALRKEIRKTRELTKGFIGVNLMVAVNDFYDLLKVTFEEKVDMVFLGAGLPLRKIPINDIRQANVKVIPIVSSSRAAKLIFKYWEQNYETIPDALVVEGPKAGGHLGFKEGETDSPDFSLEILLKDVLKEIKKFEQTHHRPIPVIAAGGIFSGKDIYKFLKMGASGVQMGSRFVTTPECDASERFKRAYLDCKKKDIKIIKSPVGLPGRAILNQFLKHVEAGNRHKFKCSWRCLAKCKAQQARYCISEALDNARKGNLEKGFAFAGANVFRIKKIISVKELFTELKTGYLKVVQKNTISLADEFEKGMRKLSSIKNEYLHVLEKNTRFIKTELEKVVEKGQAAFQVECKTIIKKIDNLKHEYSLHFDKVVHLKQELSEFFDTSAIQMPASAL